MTKTVMEALSSSSKMRKLLKNLPIPIKKLHQILKKVKLSLKMKEKSHITRELLEIRNKKKKTMKTLNMKHQLLQRDPSNITQIQTQKQKQKKQRLIKKMTSYLLRNLCSKKYLWFSNLNFKTKQFKRKRILQ